MRKFFVIITLISIQYMYAGDKILDEIDIACDKLKKTISSGDFRSFKSSYHRDAVLVNGISNKCYPIKKAFDGWKKGFDDTKEGSMDANLELKFSQRIFDSSTAHEIGIFHYYTIDKKGVQTDTYVHFESLWIKKQHKWFMLMENQKSKTNKENWDRFPSGI